MRGDISTIMTTNTITNTKKEKYHISNFLKNKSYTTQPCVVDTDNIFLYKDKLYEIDGRIKSYKVHNKPRKLSNGQWNDWTNECEMDTVYVVEDKNKIHFFDQDLYRLHPSAVREF